jgi:hypothetical protein
MSCVFNNKLGMKMIPRVCRFAVQAVLICVTSASVAQGPPGHDPDNPPPGHGGMPPGQAKKHGQGEKGMPPGQAKKYGFAEAPMPPGQAKKYGVFRESDRGIFYRQYREDADLWLGRRRPAFVPGQYIAHEYVVRIVPGAYWVGVATPPPPGYDYGYCRGYVVAYNPTTRMIADVLDLVATASSR